MVSKFWLLCKSLCRWLTLPVKLLGSMTNLKKTEVLFFLFILYCWFLSCLWCLIWKQNCQHHVSKLTAFPKNLNSLSQPKKVFACEMKRNQVEVPFLSANMANISSFILYSRYIVALVTTLQQTSDEVTEEVQVLHWQSFLQLLDIHKQDRKRRVKHPAGGRVLKDNLYMWCINFH